MEFHHFFIGALDGVPAVQGSYQAGVVLLSVLVAICMSTMAVQTAEVARTINQRFYRQIAIGTGTVAFGGGIWMMHFIGMLAFRLPAPVHYSFGLTALSLVPACGASWLALRMLVRPDPSFKQIAVGGVCVGAGIGAMHYCGMAAMMTPLAMRYDPTLFGLSIVVAVGLAILALWIQFGLRRTRLGRRARFFLSGTIMGTAIAGMHYTGMAAVRFFGAPSVPEAGIWLDHTYLSLALSSFTITVAGMVAALNGSIRARELYRTVEDSKSRLQAILNTAVDAIITIDDHGLIQEFSHSAEQMLGYTADEVHGRNVKMLMPEHHSSKHDGYLRRYRETHQSKIINKGCVTGQGADLEARHKDGTLLPIRLAVGEVLLPNNEWLFVGLIADISEHKAMEASLRATAEQAEQAAAAKGNFLANMSHEIRTPMNSIIGFTELVLQSDLESQQRTHLNTIRQSARSLLGLINDILDTTKIENGKLELEHTDFSLKALAMQIESSLRLGARAKGLRLTTSYPPDMPEFFKGDPLRLLQILTNLVGNAIKFTDSGHVDVRFDHYDDEVHVQIQDSGIGMTPNQIASIFDPFTQADASISRHFGGTGLGTTIARQLVKLMDGQIGVDSEPGQGSTFHVRIPLASGEQPADTGPRESQLALPPLRVLAADDVEQNLELLALTLEARGHEVIRAADGTQAVAKYTSGKFDVILMDVHMPGTDGLQATRLIRQHERTHAAARTPIIALTASVMANDRRAALQAGMDGFAVKPLDLPGLLHEMANVLNIDHSLSETGVASKSPASETIDWEWGVALWGNKIQLVT